MPEASSGIVKDQVTTEGIIGEYFGIASGHLATCFLARLTGATDLTLVEGLRHGTSATVAALAWVPRPLPRAPRK